MIQTLFGSLDEEQKPSFIERMKEAVSRTRENLAERIEDVVSIGKEIDRSTLDDLEATLIGADLGTTTTHEVLEKLRDKADRKQIRDVNELKMCIRDSLRPYPNALAEILIPGAACCRLYSLRSTIRILSLIHI